MTLYPIETGNFKLDGGAMFGVVPKTIWQKTNPADEKNMIDIAARSLLIEDGDRLILVDTGMGNKQSDKFFGYYYRWGDFTLDGSLAEHGFHRDDITDVFMTHLHFDHCGGSIQWNKDRTGYEPAFKNAVFWTNQDHWKWATEPNAREKASFLEENLLPMQESGQLKFVPVPSQNGTSNPKDQALAGSEKFIQNSPLDFDIFLVDGHTDKQMLPFIDYKGKKLVFVADLIPTVGHIPLPYVIGYDTRPLLTLNEKELFLNEAVENGYYLFFEHDAHNEICTVKNTEKGVRLDTVFSYNDVFR
ncbi:MAG: MBL fold metallo-hydrolase [Pricia sp.]